MNYIFQSKNYHYLNMNAIICGFLRSYVLNQFYRRRHSRETDMSVMQLSYVVDSDIKHHSEPP